MNVLPQQIIFLPEEATTAEHPTQVIHMLRQREALRRLMACRQDWIAAAHDDPAAFVSVYLVDSIFRDIARQVLQFNEDEIKVIFCGPMNDDLPRMILTEAGTQLIANSYHYQHD